MIMKKKYIHVGFTKAQKHELWDRLRCAEKIKPFERELCKATFI